MCILIYLRIHFRYGFGIFSPTFQLSAYSRTFRPVLLLRDDFRGVLLLRYDISTGPVAPRRHFLPSSSGTTFRLVLLLRDDISTCPAALGQHFDLSCCSVTTF